MISLIRGTCWRCEYQAVVGIGREDETSPIEWVPANCAACGLVSVNVDVGTANVLSVTNAAPGSSCTAAQE